MVRTVLALITGPSGVSCTAFILTMATIPLVTVNSTTETLDEMLDASMVFAQLFRHNALKQLTIMTAQITAETQIASYAMTLCAWVVLVLLLMSAQHVMISRRLQLASVSVPIHALIR